MKGRCIALVMLAAATAAASWSVAHPGAAQAPHPCPDLDTLYGHIHADPEEGRHFWLDTLQDSPHAEGGEAYWPPPTGLGNRTFVFTLEPSLAHPVALAPGATLRLDLAGRAETARHVVPGPVDAVLAAVAGHDAAPQPARDAIQTVRELQVHDVGQAQVTINATMRSGHVLVATAQASPAEDVLHVPPGERAEFEVSLSMAPPVETLAPGAGPLTLTVTRTQSLAWDVLLSDDGAFRLTLPIVDHPWGPFCPGWDLPPLNVTLDAPTEAARPPGGSVDLAILVENPERIAQNVTIRFENATAQLSGSLEDAPQDAPISVPGYATRTFAGRVTLAADAAEGAHGIELVVEADGVSVRHALAVHVPAAPTEEDPPDAPVDEETPGPEEAPEDGATPLEEAPTARSPTAGALGVLAALGGAIAAVRRRHRKD